jgi:hypothetical protein
MKTMMRHFLLLLLYQWESAKKLEVVGVGKCGEYQCNGGILGMHKIGIVCCIADSIRSIGRLV